MGSLFAVFLPVMPHTGSLGTLVLARHFKAQDRSIAAVVLSGAADVAHIRPHSAPIAL
jgi:hypothetical protein